MTRFFLRWLVNAVALYAAVAFVPGISPQSGNWLSFVWLALIFGLLNALFRPLLKFLTFPLIFLTLEYPSGPLDEAIRAAGLIPQRTLAWMEAPGDATF